MNCRPARRSRAAPIETAIKAVVTSHGTLSKPDLISLTLTRLRKQGLPAYPSNVYAALQRLAGKGEVSQHRAEGVTWVTALAELAAPGRLARLEGTLVVRNGIAKFRAEAKDLPAYQGAATITYLQPNN